MGSAFTTNEMLKPFTALCFSMTSIINTRQLKMSVSVDSLFLAVYSDFLLHKNLRKKFVAIKNRLYLLQ